MAKQFMDFNRPIMDNRQEKIAIKFTGCIKNACEAILVSMIESDYGYWLKRYPGISRYTNMMDIKEIYYNLMYYTPKQFLYEMRKPYPDFTENMITKDISRLLGDLLNPNILSMTSLEIGIREICKYGFCESIVVYDTAMNDAVRMYISKLFAGYESKVFMYTGFLKELIDEKPDITTYFIDDIEDLMIIMEEKEFNGETEVLNDKQFFVEGLNAITKKHEDGSLEFKYMDYMKDANQRFKADVQWMTSHFIDIHDPDPVVDLADYVNPKDVEDNANSINN